MAQPKISFVRGQGGLGRSLPGTDFYSGMIFYTGSLPSGFTSSANILKFNQLSDAVNAGINLSYSDETKATGTVTITAIGANGDTIGISITEPLAVVNLGTYTKTATETTVTLIAAAIVAMINAGTYIHGYTATNSAGVITITARPGIGAALNSGTPLATSIVGTLTATVAQFTSGVGSKLAVMWYHISEFFRMQPQGVLWVGIWSIPGTAVFPEIITLQNFAVGQIKQIAVYNDFINWAASQVTTLQSYAATLIANNTPASILYAANMTGNVSALVDLSTGTNEHVSVVISQDAGAFGYSLFKAFGKSITTLGNTLGTVALSSVSNSIAWVANFSISNGVECEVIGFATGELFQNFIGSSLLDQLDNYRYIYAKKFIGKSGTWYVNGNCAIALSSDYAYIENNRTIDKAIRLLYAAYLDALSSPLTLNADGTLSNTTITYFTGLGETALDQMVRDGDLSGREIIISSTQNVLSTNKLIVAAQLLSEGVARNIQVNIGYVKALS